MVEVSRLQAEGRQARREPEEMKEDDRVDAP
jgi:hypothetical protein